MFFAERHQDLTTPIVKRDNLRAPSLTFGQQISSRFGPRIGNPTGVEIIQSRLDQFLNDESDGSLQHDGIGQPIPTPRSWENDKTRLLGMAPRTHCAKLHT